MEEQEQEFEVMAEEVKVISFRVKAKSRDEAIDKVLDGKGEFPYVHEQKFMENSEYWTVVDSKGKSVPHVDKRA